MLHSMKNSHFLLTVGNKRTIRVFYPCEAARDEAQEMIADVKDYMAFAAMDAMRVLSDEFASEAEQELAMKVSELSKYTSFLHGRSLHVCLLLQLKAFDVR